MTDAPISGREHLPNYRESTSISFMHDNLAYEASFSRYHDGRLAEIFLRGRKPNSAIDEHARDAAILASLLLQHGVGIEVIRHSLGTRSDGHGGGPIGALLDLIVEETKKGEE